jgi:hypothetical protein
MRVLRLVLVVVFAAAPGVSQASALPSREGATRSEMENHTRSAFSLLGQLWVTFWNKEGCRIDPLGGCAPSASDTEAGCRIDPWGTGQPRHETQEAQLCVSDPDYVPQISTTRLRKKLCAKDQDYASPQESMRHRFLLRASGNNYASPAATTHLRFYLRTSGGDYASQEETTRLGVFLCVSDLDYAPENLAVGRRIPLRAGWGAGHTSAARIFSFSI